MTGKKSLAKSENKSISLQEFKSLFYHLNAKPDSSIKIFKESRRVHKEDLIELNEKVGEKLSNNNIVGSFTTIKVALSDKRIIDIATWEEFLEHMWDYSSYVTHIDIQWDFNIVLPRYKLPQRHTLKLRIGSTVKPGEALQILLSTESDIDAEELRAKVVCKIDYINPVVSTELLNLVEEWYLGLEKISDQNKVVGFFVKHDDAFTHGFELLFDIGGVLVGYSLVRVILYFKLYSSGESIRDIAFSLGVMWIIVYAFGYIGRMVSRRIIKSISSLRDYSMFEITKGDKNRNKELSRKNNKVVKEILIEFGVSAFIDLLLTSYHIFFRS